MSTETTTHDLIDLLAAAIANHTARRIPIAFDLWSPAEIASFLKVSVAQVVDRYVKLQGFPKPIRLPTSGARGRGHARYKAIEVIAWAEHYKEKTRANA